MIGKYYAPALSFTVLTRWRNFCVAQATVQGVANVGVGQAPRQPENEDDDFYEELLLQEEQFLLQHQQQQQQQHQQQLVQIELQQQQQPAGGSPTKGPTPPPTPPPPSAAAAAATAMEIQDETPALPDQVKKKAKKTEIISLKKSPDSDTDSSSSMSSNEDRNNFSIVRFNNNVCMRRISTDEGGRKFSWQRVILPMDIFAFVLEMISVGK